MNEDHKSLDIEISPPGKYLARVSKKDAIVLVESINLIDIEPTSVKVGETVSIKATGLSNKQSENQIFFGDEYAKIINMKQDKQDKNVQILDVQIPPNLKAGEYEVKAKIIYELDNEWSNVLKFEVLPNKYEAKITVNSTKHNGSSWDVDFSAPDILLYVNNQGQNCPNQYSCTITFSLEDPTSCYLAIYDEDLVIGEGSCVIGRKFTLGDAEVEISEVSDESITGTFVY